MSTPEDRELTLGHDTLSIHRFAIDEELEATREEVFRVLGSVLPPEALLDADSRYKVNILNKKESARPALGALAVGDTARTMRNRVNSLNHPLEFYRGGIRYVKGGVRKDVKQLAVTFSPFATRELSRERQGVLQTLEALAPPAVGDAHDWHWPTSSLAFIRLGLIPFKYGGFIEPQHLIQIEKTLPPKLRLSEAVFVSAGEVQEL